MSGAPTSRDEHPVDDLPAMIAGELSPEADQRVAFHLAGCDRCRRELAVVAQMSSWLRDAAKLTPPEPVELPPLRLPPPTPGSVAHSSRKRPRRSWVLAAAAAVIVISGAAAGAVVATSHRESAPTAIVSLSPVPGGTGSGSSGEAAMSGHGAKQTMAIHARGLANPPGHAFYEVWLLNTRTNAMLPVGVLPDDGQGQYSLPAARTAGYDAVDVSLEPNDNNPAHSDDSVLRGPITPA